MNWETRDGVLAGFPGRRFCGKCVCVIALAGFCCQALFAPAHVAAGETSTGSPATTTFFKAVKDGFAKWDVNHDGRLDVKELDELCKTPHIHGDEAAALATIKMRQRQALKEKEEDYSASEDELLSASNVQIRDLDSARGPETQSFSFEQRYKSLLKRQASLNRQLFAGDGPNFDAMHQGGIGDCFFFCVVGNLAAHQPERIKRMVSAREDGSYVVQFGDGINLRVGTPSDVEILINNSSQTIEDGVWITVLEKAVGFRLRDSVPDYKRTAEPTDAIALGGTSAKVIKLFTGHQTLAVRLRNQPHRAERLAELRRILPQALADHRLITVGMAKVPPPESGDKKIPRLGYNHVYAMFGYDPITDVVGLWNPWGNTFTPKGPPGVEHGFETKHGEFQLPLTTLYDQFSSVVVETRYKLD